MTGTGWRAVSLGLAVALLLALAGHLVVLTRDDSAGSGSASAQALLDAETGAEQAARQAAVDLTTYDYRSLDADFAWVTTAGTQAFQQRYAEVSAATRKYVAELKVHAEGSVDQAAATAQDVDHVTVLLFVDQALTSDAGPERQLATPRVQMSMVRSGGAWLVDDVRVRNLTGQ